MPAIGKAAAVFPFPTLFPGAFSVAVNIHFELTLGIQCIMLPLELWCVFFFFFLTVIIGFLGRKYSSSMGKPLLPKSITCTRLCENCLTLQKWWEIT